MAPGSVQRRLSLRSNSVGSTSQSSAPSVPESTPNSQVQASNTSRSSIPQSFNAAPDQDSTAEGNSPSTGASTTSNTRPTRGKAKNNKLKVATEGGKLVDLDWPQGHFKPVGKWANSFASEAKLQVRRFCSPIASDWKNVSKSEKKLATDELAGKFRLDFEREEVRIGVDMQLSESHKRIRHEYSKAYKACDPKKAISCCPSDIRQEDWVELCTRFASENFMNRSKKNVENRYKNDCPHTLGSKSCLREMHEMRDPETGEFPGRVDFYKRMHQHPQTGSWSSATSEARHETMVRMLEEVSQQEREVEGESNSQTQFEMQFEVAGQVLGERIGYVKTYGRGYAPPPQQSTRRNSARTEEEWNHLVQEATSARSEVIEAQNEIKQLKEQQVEMQRQIADIMKFLPIPP